MAGTSQYLENARLNWLKGTTFPTAPTTTYVALFTTAPADDAGTSAVEVSTSGTAYARVAVTSSSGWSSISGAPSAAAQVSNSGAITFASPTGSGFGTIVAAGLYDASTAGNLLWWGTVTSQAVGTGVVYSFAIGTFVITED